ncbi:putative AraC family transcriptional regulator [Gordonia hirsuta DSM 44140 = NBRC 16056]|uniref:Putative AraC family transcriptional regulator n=1 Tax=Gordonia hirsuta DSM 44140 = NBRC 16056 TaxID=1121927 RepID=L7L8V4_9ACTN|nr:helix-turn-helix domain-containing protein [Gordonia hirsuta]GAC57570.1 putative AraC family transcriptional regulator [Gordonia hirsuta DSM 44140 = NBRC 16056]
MTRGQAGPQPHLLFDRVAAADGAAGGATVRSGRIGAVRVQASQLAAGTADTDGSDRLTAPTESAVRFVSFDAPTRLHCLQSGRQYDCAPGQLVLIPPHRACRWEFGEPTRCTVLSVPSARFGGLGDSLRSAGAEPLADSMLNRAAAEFIEQLTHDVVSGRGTADQATDHVVLEMLRSTLERRSYALARTSDQQVHTRVLALIDQHFADPDLSAAQIAGWLAMSRRQLYRHYEGQDQTVAGLIAERRLEHARGLLAQVPRLSLDMIAAASGFASAGTLRRRFSARYGTTPRDYQNDTQVSEHSAEQAPPLARLRPVRPVTDAFETI